MKLLVEAPLNPLSLGNVSYNIVRELVGKGHDIGIFPIGKVDLSTFDEDKNLLSKIKDAVDNRYDYLSDDIPQLKIWHINGSEDKKNKDQYLYSFYECNQPTEVEKKICNHQATSIFSSSCAAEMLDAKYVPLGFDQDFNVTEKKYLNDVVHFGLMGKFEKRKHTANIISTWAKKYGNNNKYQLTCCVGNPFFSNEEMNSLLHNCLGGESYTNINFLPFLPKNKDVNDFLNSIDIDLTGLSGAEGWNLPAFNATCLGKWSIVLNETSHKDWADKSNSIIVESDSEFPCYDQKFFVEGNSFNQGTFYNWTEDQAISAMEEAEKKVGQINTEGQKLADKFTYSNTVDGILSLIS
jgi:hypothetical protein